MKKHCVRGIFMNLTLSIAEKLQIYELNIAGYVTELQIKYIM